MPPEHNPMTLDTHQAGTKLARDLADRIVWLSPFDPAALERNVNVISIILQEGPSAVAAGTAMLTGHFRKEAGEGPLASVEVEHKDKLILFVVQQPGITPKEEMEFAAIINVCCKALGGRAAHVQHVPLSVPGKAFRHTWTFNRLDNPCNL